MSPDPIVVSSQEKEIRTQRQDGVKTQGEESHPQARERGLRRNQPR